MQFKQLLYRAIINTFPKFWQGVTVVNETGEPVKVTNGGLDVNIQDQTTEIIDLHLSQLIQEITIVTNTSIDDTIVTINSASEPTDGNTVCFKEAVAFYQGEILSHVSNGANWDITLDTPLDYAFTTSGGCSERNINLAIDGSSGNIEFIVSPANLTSGTKWDIVRFILQINDTTAMDDGKFGGITGGLDNGIFFRIKNGITKNIFNAKTNGDLAAHMFDLTYVDDTFGPSGQYGLRGRRTFAGPSKNGVVIRLNADTEDVFECVVQDDLTDLTNFQVIVQGHIVE